MKVLLSQFRIGWAVVVVFSLGKNLLHEYELNVSRLGAEQPSEIRVQVMPILWCSLIDSFIKPPVPAKRSLHTTDRFVVCLGIIQVIPLVLSPDPFAFSDLD